MSNENILIVDDTLIEVTAFEEVLSQEGYQVDTALSGEKAVKLVKKKKYDIVFIDMVMPGMNGIETCKAVKEISPDTIPIFFTGRTDAKTSTLEREFIHEGGEVYFLYKPLDEGMILETVRKALIGMSGIDAKELIHELKAQKIQLERQSKEIKEFNESLEHRVKERTAELAKVNEKLSTHQIELEMQNEELKEAQLAVVESHKKYADLYDFAPVGYIAMGEDRLINEANLKTVSMLGVERKFLVKKSLSKLIAKEDQDKYYLCWRRAFETKEHETCEVEMVRKDGTTFYAQLECAFAQEEDGSPGQYRIIISDITERKKMEETLLHSEKLKSLGVLTAGISHEFNNILAVILGTAELLDAGFKDDQELKKGLSTIIKASDDGADIVKGLLSYVKSQEKGISDFIFSDIRHSLIEAIDFTTSRWKNMAQGKGIDYKIEREGMREVPEVLCNTTELREVFTNIINNALDAMPDGGRLSFSTSSNEDTVFIRISDTGIGMSGDVKKNIFDPFFTTRRPQGTGLGLSISYGVIMRHGGKIEVESEEGKGTTFNLSLPIRRDIVQKIVPPEPDRRAAVRKLRILVVDDNEDVCEIMYGVLARGGHDVKTVDDGVEAIALAGKEEYDLVLCDLLMPKIHGYEVIKAIKKLDKIPKIGIMTGWNEKLKPMGGEDYKVDFILKKPFKHAELAKHINELFG